jgi:hypothetical protein
VGLGNCCDVKLDDDAVGWIFASVRWNGLEGVPMLVPRRNDGFVEVEGRSITQPTALRPGAVLQFGDWALRFAGTM